MCGIAGKLSWTERPDPKILRAMTDEMRRRGPDADGIHCDNVIGLGHRRLAIIDLSAAGRQPMCDHTGRYWIVFNGEIYNFQEIRKALEEKGARFCSNSDTEVILEAYKAWGTESVRRLNGMFAFALWAEPEQTLFLARDRLGKKPLYYYTHPDGGLSFSSELKALLRDPQIPKKIAPRALSQYLSLGYVLSDGSFIEGVEKLEAAHFLLVQRGKSLTTVPYWDLAACFRKKLQISEADAVNEIRRLVDDSTRLRMISDVPLGAFLSGGIDSSSIVAAMCRMKAPRDVHTFSIGFTEKTYSEVPQARSAAAYLHVTHCDQIVSAEMAQVLKKIVYCADEPFADNSMIPMFYLSEFARQAVTVSLVGDGGDEIFAGYETYLADKYFRIARRLPHRLLSLAHGAITRFLPVSFNKVSADFKLRRFLQSHALSPEQAHYSWRMIFSDEEKRALLRSRNCEAVSAHNPYTRFAKYSAELAGAHYLDQAMYVDIKTWLVDDILVKADRMSMAHSLELRAPLLDYRLVEFAASLPTEMKLRGTTKKYIFKKSQEGILPGQIIHGKKRGFNAPIAHWLTKDLGSMLDELTAGENLFSEYFEVHRVRGLIDEHQAGRRDNSFKLFALLNLGIWLELFLHD